MKRIVILFVFLCQLSNAQVAIGNTDPATGTILHVDDTSGTKGVKLPDANIIDLNTIDPLPVGTEEGTMVYNTNAFTGQGHFYWNGFVWAPIQLFANQSAKFIFADAGTNALVDLNTVAGADIELMEGTVFNEHTTLFTPVADTSGSFNSVQVGENGRYRITVIISLELATGSGTGAIQGRLKITDNSTTPVVRYDGSYHRSTEMDETGSPGNGIDDDGTLYFTEVVELNENDKVSVNCTRADGTIQIYQHDNRTSAFIIEKLR